MDADSYLKHINHDLKKYQDFSIEELTRDQQGKTNFYENIEKMLEQVAVLEHILKNMATEKHELDYGLQHKVGDMKIHTLKYITEHLLERIHVMELLREGSH